MLSLASGSNLMFSETGIILLIIVNPGRYLFSSGICTANICRGSTHWTTQPCLSLTLAVSTLRKVLGIRLHSTALMVCTSRRGGHWGTGFLCSLLKMADDRGMAFWTRQKKKPHTYYIAFSSTLFVSVLLVWTLSH